MKIVHFLLVSSLLFTINQSKHFQLNKYLVEIILFQQKGAGFRLFVYYKLNNIFIIIKYQIKFH